MSGQIFISYRREDDAYPAGRLRDLLSARFRQSQIFMDVDMAPGTDFVEAIQKNVASCNVLIALIGKRWLTATDEGRKAPVRPSGRLRAPRSCGRPEARHSGDPGTVGWGCRSALFTYSPGPQNEKTLESPFAKTSPL
jgi:hypothetical protein